MLIVKTIGDIGSFKDKIEQLLSEGMIDSTERDMLLAVIDAGSAAAHRNYRPDDEKINHMMDILEEISYKMIIDPERKQDLAAKAKTLRERQHRAGNPSNPRFKADVACPTAHFLHHGLHSV